MACVFFWWENQNLEDFGGVFRFCVSCSYEHSSNRVFPANRKRGISGEDFFSNVSEALLEGLKGGLPVSTLPVPINDTPAIGPVEVISIDVLNDLALTCG